MQSSQPLDLNAITAITIVYTLHSDQNSATMEQLILPRLQCTPASCSLTTLEGT